MEVKVCNPTEDSLRTLLSELNNRSRMYATRFWQLPFAYLGTAGIAAAWTAGQSRKDLHILAAVFFLLGLLVLWVMIGTLVGLGTSVRDLRKIDERLNLPVTAQRYRWLLDLPNFLFVLAAMAGACYLWYRC
jgi:hypothetical protein